MANRVYSHPDMNFDGGETVWKPEARLIAAINHVKSLPNPYQGNKRKVLYKLFKFLEAEEVKFDSVLDLFSGSACVSIVMRLMGKKVVSNDILRSSWMYAWAFVQEATQILSEDEKRFLMQPRPGAGDFVQQNYAERFTAEEALFLDSYRSNIDCLRTEFDIPLGRLGAVRAIAFANMQLYIMDRCFVGGRLNKGQILAELKHRIKHLRNKNRQMPFKDIHWYSFAESVPDRQKCLAMNRPAEEALELLSVMAWDTDLAYLDPPYGGQQSDYSQMYCFFEEYILNRKLDGKDHQLIEGKRFANSQGYKDNFVSLIENCSKIPSLLISYNDSSWADVETIKGILQDFRPDVKVHPLSYQYKYRDAKRKAGVEYLILARN